MLAELPFLEVHDPLKRDEECRRVKIEGRQLTKRLYSLIYHVELCSELNLGHECELDSQIHVGECIRLGTLSLHETRELGLEVIFSRQRKAEFSFESAEK